MTARKAGIIRETVNVFNGRMWMASYGYVLNEKGEIEKVHSGGTKRELYATADEVREATKN